MTMERNKLGSIESDHETNGIAKTPTLLAIGFRILPKPKTPEGPEYEIRSTLYRREDLPTHRITTTAVRTSKLSGKHIPQK